MVVNPNTYISFLNRSVHCNKNDESIKCLGSRESSEDYNYANSHIQGVCKVRSIEV